MLRIGRNVCDRSEKCYGNVIQYNEKIWIRPFRRKISFTLRINTFEIGIKLSFLSSLLPLFQFYKDISPEICNVTVNI